MKKLITYLKTLWRRGLDSQRKKIGVTLGEATIEHPLSTYSAPFGTCWQPSGKLHSVVRCAAMLVMLFTIGSGNVWGAAEIIYTLDGNTTGGSSGYDTASDIEQDDISWKATGNTTIAPWRLGGKGGSGKNSTTNYTRTIYSTDAIADDVTSIVIETGTKTLNALTNINVKVTTGSNGSGTVKQTFTETLQASHTYTFDKPAGQDWSDCYYLITFTFQAKGTSNQYIQFLSADFYAETSSCEKIGAPTVTATPGDRQISLSWPNQAEASSYTVTCTGGTPGSVTGTTTKSCTITGLTNGTSYTWTVTPVGDGSTYCASGNTAASASATPNVFRTITYYDKDGQHTTSLADGTNIATALTALYGGDDPVSCDATNYEYFVGWKVGEISGTASSVTLLDDEVVNASSPSNNYYAVWSDTDPSAGGSELFSFDGGVAADLTDMTGVTANGFGTDYAVGNAPYRIKLDGTGDYVIIAIASQPSKVTIGVKMIGGNSTSSITVQESTAADGTFTDVETLSISGAQNDVLALETSESFKATTRAVKLYFTKGSNVGLGPITIEGAAGDAEYITTCCDDPGLAYGTASVTKTFGNGTFKNTLTNSHSVSVTYESSNTDVATVASDGTVTIQGAGNATITARFAGNSTYCADEASYTLTVNKASISPTLTYDPAAVTVGSTLTSFTLSGNSGSGSVSYSSSNDAIATVNSSGVVTGVAPGTVTIIATIAATTNYNGNTATSNTITVNAAACTGVNSLHTGNKDQGGWVTNQCFEDADWGAADDAIYVGAFPLTNECYVGWAGGGSYYGTNWAVGGIKTYDIPTGRTLGWNSGNYYESYPGGALGTFHIYKNSTDENYYLRFKPSSYILRTGSDGTSWTSREMTVSATNSHYYETAELDLTSTLISEHAYVDLKTNGGDGHVWCNFSNDRTASGNVKVKSSVGDADGNFRGDNLKASDNGTHGKFRIDVTKDVDNWKLAFVPMYRITYAPGTGASGSMDPSSYAEISTTIAAAANGYTAPTGKQFNGWSDGVNSYAAGANVTMNSNVTLTAQWTDIDYTVTVSQSPDVSATTTGQTTTAHYNGTINLSTTVPSGYRFVNWTTSDGFSITNPTSATTASFTMPNKNVTVTANFQQTHTVDWYVGGSAPANKIGDDGQTTVVDHGGKIEDFPATTPDGSACDKTFVGWTNTSSYVHGTSPLFNDVAGSPTINADAQFYAVFATGGSGEIFSEDFASFTSGSISSPSSSAESSLDGFDNITYVYQAGGVAKLGTGSYSGSLTTDELTIAAGSSVTISFEVFGWTSVEGDIIVSCDNSGFSNQTVTYTATRDQSMESKSVTVTCTVANPKITIATSTKRAYIDNISISASSYTGYTINCADCGTSVTPTYAASPTGGTVSVTKSATPVTSGSTVKTCTAVDLTVTITPASHYDLTGFTATGLTTGTATITPAVGSTLPVSVAQTFTVTVSAGATGTLTLAPTFTAQTPLSITLETHSKGTFTPIGDIYSGESFTFPTVTPSDAECSSFLGWIEGTTFVDDGTETDPTAITGLANYHAAGSSSGTLTTTKTYTAVFGEKDTQVIPAYQKVTSAPSNWSGDYLIVRDDNSRAFDGSLSTLDAADNYIGVTISDGSITANSTVNASKWTIAKVGETSNYTIKSASGYYIGRTANSNGLNSSTSEEYTNTLAYSTDHVDITSSAGPKLQMNGGTRFRYYGTSQQVLQLYKYNPDAEVVAYTYCTNPACTPRYRVTISSATGGSPEADKTYEHADETITITANPAAGYSFTSWTITKTTGGDNVTSTLLTGDKPTTANTTFTMPAYDITIAATYTKKMVSTLEVKDGATVISTTTGPVSGTVNISTGANKTLDVVITPSDAYDHSWTATVSAGSTYASITNVTDDGFRVNGLAQGDATITVNAPNDGSAKSVTFTVHVTDIMPEEIILKRDGSETPINALTIYLDQYAKINVSYSPTPTDKAFTFSSADATSVSSRAHAPASGYETLHGLKVTSSPVNCTFTSATGSVTKVLAVTVLALPADQFIDYIHGNATVTRAAQVSADHWSINTSITTPTLSDAAESASADCEEGHYHLIGWLPQATAESLWAAGTPITSATEGLVAAGAEIEASGITWYAIWAKKE